MQNTSQTTDIQTEIERTLRTRMPEVEVLLTERPSAGMLRIVIDREPGGVDLALCEQVTRELESLRDRFGLEVSSPGLDRPLTKAQHFARVVGQTVAVRTDHEIHGRRSFTGVLQDAGEEHIDIDQDGQTVRIELADVRRGNLVFDPAGGTP